MKCIHCGNEIPDNSIFCTFCGKPTAAENETPAPAPAPTPEQVIPQEAPVESTPIVSLNEKVLTMFKDPLFLTLCILISSSALLSLFSGSIPVIQTLFTIFIWLIFAKARNNSLDIQSMRCISGTIFASYIINWVAAGLLVLASVIGIFGSIAMGGMPYIFEEIFEEAGLGIFSSISAGSFIVVLIFAFIILLIAAVAIAAINFFGYRIIHRFAKSLYKSCESGVEALEPVNTIINWFLAFAIIQGVGTLFSISHFLGFLANGATCATYIMAYLLFKKYFKS